MEGSWLGVVRKYFVISFNAAWAANGFCCYKKIEQRASAFLCGLEMEMASRNSQFQMEARGARNF